MIYCLVQERFDKEYVMKRQVALSGLILAVLLALSLGLRDAAALDTAGATFAVR
jgi:hypothetical protein